MPFTSSPFILSLFSADIKFKFLFENQFLFLLFVIFYLLFYFIFTEKIPPVFTVNPPVQMLISSGGKASMTCKASGFPVPLITWFKDGIPVPRANTTGDKGLSILTLEFVKPVNQGKYWCEANNSDGWQRSLITKLSLSQGKLSFFSSLEVKGVNPQ